MQSAVIARGIPSVRPSVRHVPVLCKEYEFQANEDTIVRFSATGRTMPLVSEDVKFVQILLGITPSGGIKVWHPSIDSENLTNNRP